MWAIIRINLTFSHLAHMLNELTKTYNLKCPLTLRLPKKLLIVEFLRECQYMNHGGYV